jgi:hypothetical protein
MSGLSKGSGMRLWVNMVAVVLLLVGAIWILQGASIVGGSFMTGQLTWLYIGIAVAIAGLGMLLWANFR